MKMGSLLCTTTLGLAALVASARAADSATPQRVVIRVQRPGQAAGVAASDSNHMRTSSIAAPTATYSSELPQISRVAGQAFYRTAVDITNNTSTNGVVALVQYAYTCTGANGCAAGFFTATNPIQIPLQALDSFHSDDMVSYLNDQGVLAPGAVDGSFGSLLVTFSNLPSATGWEGTVTARNYNRVNEANPSLGTVGYAYNGSLFFESAHSTVVGTIRDTSPAALAGGTQGSQRTNLGVRNTDIDGSLFPGTDRHVTVDVTFYDVTAGSATNGQKVGSTVSIVGIAPGEVRQVSNVFAAAQIPATVSSAIAFVDVRSPTANTPTIEGYFNVGDNVTNDFSFFEARCGDTGGTCGQ